jgi:hypothetical protein
MFNIVAEGEEYKEAFETMSNKFTDEKIEEIMDDGSDQVMSFSDMSSTLGGIISENEIKEAMN